MPGSASRLERPRAALGSCRALAFVAVLAGATLRSGTGSALPAEPASRGVPLDRVVIFVDQEAILASEVEAVLALGLVATSADDSLEARRKRALDALVDDRLRARDLARFGEPDVPADDVDLALGRAAARVGGRARFDEIALRHGIDPAGLRTFFRRQIAATRAFDERFGGTVFISDEEVRDFVACDELLRELLARDGVSAPESLTPEIVEEVRALLVRRRLNEQFERWMEGLRAKARIESPGSAP